LLAVVGATVLLLLLKLFVYIVVPTLSQVLAVIGIEPILTGIRISLTLGGYIIAGMMAVAIFLLGFRWQYRRAKADSSSSTP